MSELLKVIFTLKKSKEGANIPKYVQSNLFNTKEGAGIFCVFTCEGAFPALSVYVQCFKGWCFYLYLVQNKEFWPRIDFSLCFHCSVDVPIVGEVQQPPSW